MVSFDENATTSHKFSKSVIDVLGRSYCNGMTGWGENHAANIAIATGSTGLKESQVKVFTIIANIV